MLTFSVIKTPSGWTVVDNTGHQWSTYSSMGLAVMYANLMPLTIAARPYVAPTRAA